MEKRIGCRWVWTGSGEILENMDVLISGETITGFERNDSPSEYFLMPAFVDAHSHFTWAGLKEVFLNLADVSSRKDLLKRVRAAAENCSGIIRGEQFEENLWYDPALPTLEEMDEASPERPVFLRRICGHLALVNSATLNLIPEEFRQSGKRSCVLKEGIVLQFNSIFPPEKSSYNEAIKHAARISISNGVTAQSTTESKYSYGILADSKHLLEGSVRLTVSVPCHSLDEVPGMDFATNSSEKWLRAFGVKFFLDGSLGAGTAATEASFIHEGKTKNVEQASYLLWESRELRETLKLVEKRELMPVVHAIGAKALRQIEEASRCIKYVRIEHAEELLPVWQGEWSPERHIFSMQPNFVSRWQMPGGLYYQRLPAKQVPLLNPFGLVKKGGFMLGFGSDGMPFGPLKGLSGATEHPVEDYRLSADEALRAYTLDAASVAGWKELSIPLKPGRIADLVVLSDNPLGDISWKDLEVISTICAGKTVFGENLLKEAR